MFKIILPGIYTGLAYVCSRIVALLLYKGLLPGVPDAGPVPVPMLPWLLAREALKSPSRATSHVWLFTCAAFVLPPLVGVSVCRSLRDGGIVAVEVVCFVAFASHEIWLGRGVAVAGESIQAYRAVDLWVSATSPLLLLASAGTVCGLIVGWYLRRRGIDLGHGRVVV